jgi:long-chain acyl-CoA synthetase
MTALIVPNWEALTREEKLEEPPEQLVQHPRVSSLIQTAIDQLNQGLASFERVKYFRLLADDFAEGDGELTPTQKTTRRAIQQRYKALIDTVYQGRP